MISVVRRIPLSRGTRPRCVRCGAFLRGGNESEVCEPCYRADDALNLLIERIEANHKAQARRERKPT